jgi:DNA-binding GntR family transcriptional regulator
MGNMDTIGSSTYKKIKRDIIFGELKPSSKLKLDEIKKKYPVSLSTIRETLNRLSSEGFVVAEEQRGFFVSPFSREDLIEIAKLRILLESHALNLSLKNGDTDWEGNLVAAHHKLSLIENKMDNKNKEIVESWKKYDWEFHLACIAACGSKNLMALHSNLFDRYLRYQIILLQFRGEEAIDEHNQIYNFSKERDTDNAIKYLKIHIEKGLEHALDLFQDQI